MPPDNFEKKEVEAVAVARPSKEIILEEVFSWAKMIVITVLAAVLLNQFVIVNATIPTGSMEYTIMENDRVVAFRLSYLFNPPERFHIVIFRSPDNETRLYVKRIIGLPGETVEIRGGRVFIDGAEEALRDDFVKGAIEGYHGPVTVPEDHYFVLGDYRSNSSDSRRWNNPFVRRDQILGRAVFKYFRGFAILQ